MKKIIFACLIGMGALLPSSEAKSNVVKFVKVVDVTISGWVLYATSQTEDGPISQIEIYRNSDMALILTQSCSGYACSVNIYDLPTGGYVAKVYCTNTTYTRQFKR